MKSRLGNTRVAWAAGILMVAGAWRAPAQTTGSIEGIVQDPSRAAVSGAVLHVVEAQTGAERTVYTEPSGWYLAPGLAPGVYRIEISHPGLRGQVRSGLDLAAGRSVRVDFLLELGETRERIEVAGDAPLVNPTASDWGGSIERRQLDSLPLNGRDLFDLASQEMGATLTPTAFAAMTTGMGVHISVNGNRPNQTGFRMDGIHINDATSSAPASAAGRLVGVEGVAELRLVTSPFSAEYGRSAGAVFTAVSKSGTNQLHGSLYEFLRNSALDAKDFFDAPGETIPPLRKNQFGGLLSGPVRRNRIFLLGNYEGIRERTSQTVRSLTLTEQAHQGKLPGPSGVQTVPVAAKMRPYIDLYPLPSGVDFGDGTAEYISGISRAIREDYAAGKVDFLFSDRFRTSVRYTFDDTYNPFADPFHLWTLIDDSRYQFLHTETQYIQSPRTIHAFRAGFSRVRNSESGTISDRVPTSLSFVSGEPMGDLQVVGLTDLGGFDVRTRPRRYATNDFQFNHDVTHVWGAHTVRLGGGYDRVHYNQRADYNSTGYYRFTSISNFLQGRPASGDLMVPGSDSIRGWRQHQFFGFVQEDFRASPRLTLTLGVRYEGYTPPDEVNGKIAVLADPVHDTSVRLGGPVFVNPSHRNFAPRASLAWDPFGSGRTVIRAGAGVFFDLLGVREMVVAGARMPPYFNRVLPINPGFPDLLAAVAQAAPGKSVDTFEYYANQPTVLQFQFAIQHQLDSETAMQIGYAGSRGLHLVGQLTNINTARPQVLPDGRLYLPPTAPRVNPAFEQIGMRSTQFNSFYHSMLAGVQRRWRGGFRFQAKYTWAKSIDEASNAVFSDFRNSDGVPTVFNLRQNRGPSDFDVRHAVAGNLSWRLPSPEKGIPGALFGGWNCHAILQAQTGAPFAPRVGFDRLGIRAGFSDAGQRPDFVAAPGARVILGDPQRYFDPLAFGLPAVGLYGNLGRGTLQGPGLAALNAALHRTLWGTDRQNVQFRAEWFNITNHPNFQAPFERSLFDSGGKRLGSAGRLTETSTTARQIQLALKWVF